MDIKTFIQEYQDLFVESSIEDFIDELEINETEQERQDHLGIIVGTIDDIENQTLNVLTACRDFKESNIKLLKSLEDKINFINYTALNYSKFYTVLNENNLVDTSIYDITSMYSNTVKYNTLNNSLELNSITQGTLIKDSTAANIYYNSMNYISNVIEISHESLINVTEFNCTLVDRNGVNQTTTLYPDGNTKVIFEHTSATIAIITLSLPSSITPAIVLSNKLYNRKGSFTLPSRTFKSSGLLSLPITANIPNLTYCNLNIDISTVNSLGNLSKIVSISLPVNNDRVCKEVSHLNTEEIGKIVGLWIGDTYLEDDTLTLDYLLTVENKEDTYVVYRPVFKTGDIINNKLRLITNSSFEFLDDVYTDIIISGTFDMYSFDKKYSPQVSHIIGFTKDE